MSILSEQTPLPPPAPQKAPTEAEQPATANTKSAWRWVDGAWRLLADPRLLAAVGLLLLMLILLGMALPQMPGQLRSEPLAADRWLTAAAERYGVWGGLLRGLGIFDVLRSPFLLLILAALIFVLLVQAADAVLAALALRRLPALLDNAAQPGGEALPVVVPHRVERWRGAVTLSSAAVLQACEAAIRPWAGRVERRMLRVTPALLQTASAQTEQPQTEPPQTEPPPPTDAPITIVEERLLGVSGWVESALRPLLPTGMILALLVVGGYSLTGHSFLPAPLLPGERTSDAVLDLTAEYQLIAPQPGMLGPVLTVSKGDRRQTLPLQQASITLDNVIVNVQPGAPALVVYTLDELALLARPGQSNRVSTIGLGFPYPGSEQVLVLPQSGVGVRMIRQDSGTPNATDDTFAVEVFQGDSEEPVQRFTIDNSTVKRVVTPTGDVPLGFAPIAMFQVQAYTAPAAWLLIPALLLAAVGAYGFRRRPGFLLAQVGPWPVERSVVVLQTDRLGELEGLRHTLDTEQR